MGGDITLFHGDCLNILASLPECVIDCIATDPPYGLSFMGKGWDYKVPGPEYWRAALRVCKPGAMLMAFGGTKTFHRLTCAVEDAGWEIRDMLMWLYSSGMPKCGDIGKLIDKSKGVERKVVGTKIGQPGYSLADNGQTNEVYGNLHNPQAECDITAPGTPEAAKWTGWASALKPAVENIIVAQKPNKYKDVNQSKIFRLLYLLEKQLWQLKHAYNVKKSLTEDSSKFFVQTDAALTPSIRADLLEQMDTLQLESVINLSLNTVISWRSILEENLKPARMSTIKTKIEPTIDWKILRYCLSQITPTCIVQSGMQAHGLVCNAPSVVRYFNAAVANIAATRELSALENVILKEQNLHPVDAESGFTPEWTPIILARKPLDGTQAHNALTWGCCGMNIDASRIQYDNEDIDFTRVQDGNIFGSGAVYGHGGKQKETTPLYKPNGRWPSNVLIDESVQLGDAQRFFFCSKASKRERGQGNNHPTIKPLDLMKYLLTLLSTPTGGLILDPFAGSGTTLLAAQQLGRSCVGIELDEHYCEIIKGRLDDNSSKH